MVKNGSEGGEDSQNVSLSLQGTTGEHTLTLDEIPSHNHGASAGAGTTSVSGSHTHTNAGVHITGSFQSDNELALSAQGAFYGITNPRNGAGAENNGYGATTYFDSSRQSAGNTSSSGSHSHTFSVTVSAQGGGKPHTHPVSVEGSTGVIHTVPKYYSLAYFVKLPGLAVPVV